MQTNLEKGFWWDETWNPITGCSKISEACQNCYAERMSHRLAGRYGYPKSPNQFRPTFHADKLTQPLVWKKPRRIFTVSMGDMFHESVPIDWIDSIFRIMRECQQHTFIILTKRPQKMSFAVNGWFEGGENILPNIWLGVTAENQQRADERIPILLQIPAVVRFVSIEPMLEKINLTSNLPKEKILRWHRPMIKMIDWVICGAETGPGARPMKWHWATMLWEQCDRAGIPFFFKKESSNELVPEYVKNCMEFPK